MTDNKDILLNVGGDTAIIDGDTYVIGGADRVRQSWLIHMSTVRGELLTNADVGVPYFGDDGILEKFRDTVYVEKVYTDETLNVPGVVGVNGVSVEVVDEINRTYSVTVDCEIEGEEGTTSEVFNYQGAIPAGTVENESSAVFPTTIDGLKFWFDANDLSNITYDTTSDLLRLENKGGSGYALGTGTAGVDLPTLVGVSPLNNKRSIHIHSPAFAGGVIAFYDTPTIRPADTFTVFYCGGVFNSSETGLFALRGQNDLGTVEEANWLTYYNDGVSPWVRSYSKTASVSAADSETSIAHAVPICITAIFKQSATSNFYIDGVFSAGDATIVPRELDGDGYIGAGMASDCQSTSYFGDHYFGEIMAYEGELTSTQIANVNSWLMGKWGM